MSKPQWGVKIENRVWFYDADGRVLAVEGYSVDKNGGTIKDNLAPLTEDERDRVAEALAMLESHGLSGAACLIHDVLLRRRVW